MSFFEKALAILVFSIYLVISLVMLGISAFTVVFGRVVIINGPPVIGGIAPYSYEQIYVAHPYDSPLIIITLVAFILLIISLFCRRASRTC